MLDNLIGWPTTIVINAAEKHNIRVHIRKEVDGDFIFYHKDTTELEPKAPTLNIEVENGKVTNLWLER